MGSKMENKSIEVGYWDPFCQVERVFGKVIGLPYNEEYESKFDYAEDFEKRASWRLEY
jgi:hypothetical protein